MKLSIVLSTHAAQFQAVALKGDFESNVAKIAGWGYDGVEIAIRDPRLVDGDELQRVVSSYGLDIPATRYLEALSLRPGLLRRFIETAFADCDLLLLPVSLPSAPEFAPTEAWLAGEIDRAFS